MLIRTVSWTVLFAVALLAVAAPVRADLPNDRQVMFSIRETPSDPGSPVTFTVTLHLVADQVDDHFVGWTVASAIFDKLGTEPKQWIEERPPLVDSPDGLWWIEHADPLNPEVSEFRVTPRLIGRAPALVKGDEELDYEFEATFPLGAAPPAGMATAHYVFQRVNAVEPEAESEEDDEPVEVDDIVG